MNEGEPRNEERAEYIPGIEEVRSILRDVIKGDYEEIHTIFDDKGLCVLEVEVRKQSERAEYCYVRKGKHKSGHVSSANNIDVVYYRDGEMIGGDPVAEYVDGAWKFF